MKHLNIRYWLICLIILIILLPLAGCQLPTVEFPRPDQQASTPPTPATAPTPINPDWKLPVQQPPAPLLPNISDVVAKVKPSVVAINTKVVSLDIFNRTFTQQGAGSGWIISTSGLIVTNNHVVEGAKTVTVTLNDARTFTVETIRTDPLTDLAVLKINAGKIPALPVGKSSQLRVGDWVVAIGNPLGLGISAKQGIISRLGVPISFSSGQTLYDLIETSAAINPGNSGGPLVNMAGEVIGITSAKIAQVGVEGLGYAINISTAAPIIEELVKTGYVIRPWLGVVLTDVDQGVAARFGLAVNQGALVTQIAPDSPADKAGLRQGDVIVGFDNQKITNVADLIQVIHASKIGRTAKVTYWRGDSQNTTQVTLAKSPPP